MNNTKKIAIICGSFHRDLIEQMLNAAKACCVEERLEVIKEVWVPGSFEVPLALQRNLADSAVDGAVLLGIIEKGETAHGLVMAQAVFPAVIKLQLKTGKPVGIGIIGPEASAAAIEPRLIPYAQGAVRALAAMLSA